GPRRSAWARNPTGRGAARSGRAGGQPDRVGLDVARRDRDGLVRALVHGHPASARALPTRALLVGAVVADVGATDPFAAVGEPQVALHVPEHGAGVPVRLD